MEPRNGEWVTFPVYHVSADIHSSTLSTNNFRMYQHRAQNLRVQIPLDFESQVQNNWVTLGELFHLPLSQFQFRQPKWLTVKLNRSHSYGRMWHMPCQVERGLDFLRRPEKTALKMLNQRWKLNKEMCPLIEKSRGNCVSQQEETTAKPEGTQHSKQKESESVPG